MIDRNQDAVHLASVAVAGAAVHFFRRMYR
jgi:hypothetical protein